jgi:hypothetical protein
MYASSTKHIGGPRVENSRSTPYVSFATTDLNLQYINTRTGDVFKIAKYAFGKYG